MFDKTGVLSAIENEEQSTQPVRGYSQSAVSSGSWNILWGEKYIWLW